jgi:hypothetical protein
MPSGFDELVEHACSLRGVLRDSREIDTRDEYVFGVKS